VSQDATVRSVGNGTLDHPFSIAATRRAGHTSANIGGNAMKAISSAIVLLAGVLLIINHPTLREGGVWGGLFLALIGFFFWFGNILLEGTLRVRLVEPRAPRPTN
jgi:hypothetical protein